MKTLTVQTTSGELSALLEQARDEDVLVQTSDGTEYVVSIVDDFDLEVARTRQNQKLMAFLEERSKQTETVPLAEVKRKLGLD